MLSRRRFLTTSSAALAALPMRSFCATSERADVVIIGAGIAGLTAAVTLVEEGVKVLVVEASGGVGGRMHTFNTPLTKINPGATTVGPLYARIRNLLGRFQVGAMAPPPRGAMGVGVAGQLVSSADWANSAVNQTRDAERNMPPWVLENRLLSANNPLDNPFSWLEAENDHLDIPIADLLTQRGASPEARRLIDITINANGLSESSALMYLRDLQRLGWAQPSAERDKGSTYAPGADGQFVYIAGGTQSLPNAMADFLGDRVRLRQPVVAVEHIMNDGVEVICRGGERYRADHVVCAAPLTVVKNIRWEPALTGSVARLAYGARAASVTHIYFTVEKPFWEDDIGEPALFTDTILERVFARMDPATNEAIVLDCWINGRNAWQIDAVPKVDLGAFTTGILNRLRPSTKDKVKFMSSFSWGLNPYQRGNKHDWLPGEIATLRSALEQDTSPIYFAGEHFRIGEPGMEGAAEAGERAALKILGAV